MKPTQGKEFRATGTPVANMTPRAGLETLRPGGKSTAAHSGGPAVNSLRVNTNKSKAGD